MKKLTAYHKDVLKAKICPYCKSKTKVVPQKYIYKKTYDIHKNIICCVNWPQCDSYVGTDSEGYALGRLAKKELRNAKKEAHKHFDILWKENYVDRSELYLELSFHLDINIEYTHIGMFGIETCMKVIEWSKQQLNNYTN